MPMGLLWSLVRRKRLTDKMRACMKKLTGYGESVLFVSRHGVDELSTVCFYLAGDIDEDNQVEEAYLQLRQLLYELEEKVNLSKGLKLTTKLTRTRGKS